MEPEASRPCTQCQSKGRPSKGTNAFDIPAANRTPSPAAGTSAATRHVGGVGSVSSGGGSENFVEQHLGVVLVGAFGESELAYQNLAGLGQHALLTSRQAAITLTTPQIPDYFCHLVDVARGEFFQVGLVPP